MIEADPVQKQTAKIRPALSVVRQNGGGLPEDAMAFPGELTLLLRVPLPLSSHRQRQAAVGFAVEDMIAEPLESSHVVLGPELGRGEYLAIVTRAAEIRRWASKANAQRLRLVPDILGVPVAADGACSAQERNGRVLVRRADGTGYVTNVEQFEEFWRADGEPRIVLFGGELPHHLPISATGILPAVPTPEASRVNLLEGPFARDGRITRRFVVRLAALAIIVVGAHLGVLALDIHALNRIAGDRQAALRAELLHRVPNLPPDLSIDVMLRRAMPSGDTEADGFLPLLAKVSETLLALGDGISMSNIAYEASDGTLAITVEASDLAKLQQVVTSLQVAGLSATAGAATNGDGTAQARIVIGGSGK